ncbi:zinc finger and SCAN domain-containing protein 22-like isoform X3 [Sphaerodactylus townsendi]|uniref:zinc finger and SCAN domain-containing protein 22-like isoform X3 n=1 Tax=Sphaerodactylus townsendi TaxID=933632 RepID=UPI00202692AC|nr:zinc finger and SCAN domain-containing protein 22-like isoform X3 [Sphaerodactylus townsendi]
MKGQSSALPKEGPEGARNPVSVTQSEFTGERSSWKATQESRWDPSKGMQQHWETQWQEFLKTLQSPHSAWGGPQLAETPLWDDAKAFLTSFEQVAQACQWPREEWVARLLPALSGEAQQAFGILEARDREDYGKVKAAILRGEANRMEALRQHFRQFRSREVEDPRRLYSQLQELCHQWLRPERHSKEQILELLILEQFLAILPPELQSWIRAGGPENCTQAAALVDDFLLTQQKAETWKWQEPLQEMIRGTLEVEESASDFDQRPVVKVTKGNNSREAGLLGSQMTCPNDSDISLPPKEQDATKAKLAEMPATLKETGVPLHMVEPALPKPSQRTMFWQVMQEDEGNADSLEGLLVPKSGLEKGDEMFAQFPGESERLPGQDPGLEKRSRIKMEGSRKGEAGPEETQGMTAEISQWNFPAATEIHVPRCDEKRSQIKVENWQQVELGPEEAHWSLGEIAPWDSPNTAEMYEQKYKCHGDQGTKPAEGEHGRSEVAFTASVIANSAATPWAKKPLVSKYGRRYHCRSGFVTNHTAEDFFEQPISGDNLEPKSYLVKHQMIQMGERSYVCSECGKSFHLRSNLMRHQKVHTGENPYECPVCGKSFTSRGAVMVHQIIHTGEKPFGCPQCGKWFNQRTNLLRHQRIHTGEKVHECPKCGKNFYRRDKLSQHQRIHTREKRYECPECGKSFIHKEKFLRHQRIHRGF